jgi:ankyrin repeat protein
MGTFYYSFNEVLYRLIAVKRCIKPAYLLGVILLVSFTNQSLPAQLPGKVDFARDVQPLFRTNCYGCHGPQLQSGGFRLDRRRDSMPNRVGANGARIVPGNSASSRLYLKVSGNRAGLQMPPTGALSPEQIDIIKTWIDQGAEWPDELAGETPTPPQDPIAVQLMDSIRRGDRTMFEKLLREKPQAAGSRGLGGSTPLMYAALYGDVGSMRLLLDKGADVNIRNDAGATALLWAVDDVEKTRLLLDHAANVNARSEDGLTALTVAASQAGSGSVVRLLLEHGAKLEGQPALSAAASAGDEAVMRMLLDRGAERKPLPGDLALHSDCTACIDLVLQSATREDMNRVLVNMSRFGEPAFVKTLLDHGADANVIALNPRANEKTSATPLTKPQSVPSARSAVEKSLPLLQHADVVFLKQAGCVSCHNNSLFLMTASIARKKGFRIDESSAPSQLKATGAYIESWRERVLQDLRIPGGLDTTAYILAGLAAADYAPDPATDALALYLKRHQSVDGRWRMGAQRPPIESSDFENTAMALRGLEAYAPKPQRSLYAQAIQRGAAWLARSKPESNEDRVFQLLGLGWAHASKDAVRKAVIELIGQQRADGGWAQIPSLGSDGYATGQALTALVEAGGLKASDRVYQRGVRFLLETQLADGSWYVRSRAYPVQPYFDSEFPHERDQFISAAATNWATIALALAR